jgi:hypothetical protein
MDFASIEDSFFMDNIASNGSGGALYVLDSVTYVKNSHFSRNSALRGGGGGMFWNGHKNGTRFEYIRLLDGTEFHDNVSTCIYLVRRCFFIGTECLINIFSLLISHRWRCMVRIPRLGFIRCKHRYTSTILKHMTLPNNISLELLIGLIYMTFVLGQCWILFALE